MVAAGSNPSSEKRLFATAKEAADELGDGTKGLLEEAAEAAGGEGLVGAGGEAGRQVAALGLGLALGGGGGGDGVDLAGEAFDLGAGGHAAVGGGGGAAGEVLVGAGGQLVDLVGEGVDLGASGHASLVAAVQVGALGVDLVGQGVDLGLAGAGGPGLDAGGVDGGGQVGDLLDLGAEDGVVGGSGTGLQACALLRLDGGGEVGYLLDLRGELGVRGGDDGRGAEGGEDESDGLEHVHLVSGCVCKRLCEGVRQGVGLG